MDGDAFAPLSTVVPLVRKSEVAPVAEKRALILAFARRSGCEISDFAMRTLMARRYPAPEPLLRDLKRCRIFRDLGL